MHPNKLIPTQRAALADAANGPLMRCAGGYHGASLHTVRATNALRRADFLRPADAFAAELRITDAGRRALDDAARNDAAPTSTQAAA